MNHVYYPDLEVFRSLRDSATAFWKMAWVYRSNWRVLHIDGLEGGRKIPISTGKPIQFFQYAGAK